MFNLLLSDFPEFSTSESNDLPFQEWSFDPESFIEVASFIGGPTPPDLAIQTKVKNYIASLGTNTYSSFYVSTEIFWFQVFNIVEWFSLSGPIPTAPGNGYLLTQSNLNVNTVLDFQNMQLMAPGTHQAVIYHKVKGQRIGGGIEEIETVNFYLKLKRLSYNDVLTSPVTLDFSHLIGATLPVEKKLQLYANGVFTLKVSSVLDISGGNISFLTESNGIKTYTGSGTQEVDVGLNATIEAEGVTDPYFEGQIYIENTYGSSDVTRVLIYQYASVEYQVSPSILNFQAIKDFQEAGSKNLNLIGYGTFNVTGPSWLEINPPSGENNSLIFIKPIDSANLNAGNYSGLIKIETSSNTLFVEVIHNVFEQFDTGFVADQINFTKDRNTISTIYGSNSFKLNIDISTRSFNYKTLTAALRSASFTKGIYDNQTDFFLGKVVEKMMPTIKKLNDINFGFQLSTSFMEGVFKYYNPSETSITFTFKSRFIGGESIPSTTINNVLFLKGRKPKRYMGDYGIIDFMDIERRVTKKSFAVLNMLRVHSARKLIVFRNGIYYNQYSPIIGGNHLFGLMIKFIDFTPGDIIDVAMYNGGFTTSGVPTPEDPSLAISQRYVMFPEGKQSYHILWEDEHALIQAIEFTGDYQFSSSHNEIIGEEVNQYLEETVKYDSEIEWQLTANTGWLLKSNQIVIDSLVRSKKAWLKFPEHDRYIRLIARSSEIINEDSEQKNYEYAVKFKINPDHELENITR